MNNPGKTFDLCVIGGGPAGMMAAGRAAACGERVLLLEKNESLGRKLLITGGGRCNVTNAETRRHVLVEKYGERGKFLHSLFARFGSQDTRDFFHSFGLETRVEEENRVFPVTDQAKSVLDVLVRYLDQGGVELRTRSIVKGFKAGEARQLDAVQVGGELIRARRFVLATGGTSHPETGSTGDGFAFLRQLGHTVRDPEASLVPIVVREGAVKALQGLSIQDARLTARFVGNPGPGVTIASGTPAAPGLSRVSERGKLLFTHFGLSGPLALNLSTRIRELERDGLHWDPHGAVTLEIDLLPTQDHGELDRQLLETFQEAPNRKVKNTLQTVVPARFAPVLLEAAGVDGEKPANGVSRAERKAVVAVAKGFSLTFAELRGSRHAIVSSGGVALEEVDFRSMRSRLYENLYLAGDILDFQRRSGGYSLQICWSTGWVAGNSACTGETSHPALS